jgi:protein involved in polysaccharide export with SLBB domain
MKILLSFVATALIAAGDSPLWAQTPVDALQPGDVVRLRVYREPDLSGEFSVNEEGSVVLPRLGTIRVVEWPADSIRPRVTRAMEEFLRDPVIEVTILRRIAIYGFVIKPGLYPVDPTMTVQEALALAGGAITEGRRDRVELIRNNQRVLTNLAETTQLQQIKLRSGDQLFVPELSWWARNGRVVVPSVIGAAATVTAVLLRR